MTRLLALACMLALAATLRAADDVPETWAYEKLATPAVPTPRDAKAVRTPVDAFVLAKLEAAGLTLSREADRATLIRRLTFDLTGLPPTPPEVADFVADTSPGAYERVVERLLASPHYGERQAQHWLDVVRFAESDGFKQDDPRPTAYLYRDYVARSFNADKGFDRFVQEQVAGDELFPDNADALIATGMNRHYPDEYNAVNLEQRRYEILTDITDTIGSGVMGLTIGCARCHDHKFDPISHRDYFRTQAFFAAWWPVEKPVYKSEAERAADRARRAEWERRTADLRAKMAALEGPVLQKLSAKRRERFPAEYARLLDVPLEKQTPLERQIGMLIRKQVVDQIVPEVVKTMKAPDKQAWEGMAKAAERLAGPKPKGPPAGLVCTDVGPVAPPTFVLKRGNHLTPGKPVVPGFLEVFEEPDPAIAPTATTTGRRAALAKWLTRPDQPLTTRVIVNRLWQQHFGRGIVGTPNDLGVQGDRPTHPELLDWLAGELVRQNWSLKAVHRAIVTSAAYRQSSRHDAKAAEADPENKLLWKQNRQRLDGESVRDAILAASGALNPAVGGPSVFPELPADLKAVAGSWKPSATEAERDRRSLYLFVKRNLRYPLLSAFDAPDRTETCGRRFVTTSAPQALMLLNDKLVLGCAAKLAARVEREAGGSESQKLDRLFRLTVGHAPTPAQAAAARAFLARQGTWPDLCHAVLNANEFLSVD